jgi:dihydrofolate synthase/folylpolyglutamate synthase
MTAFADFTQAQTWVFDLQKYGIKFGLSSTLNLVARLGIPYERGQYLHLAGTNGKGSVAAMLSAILTRAGFPVGLFTSPHLVRFEERFRLRDKDISPGGLLDLINQVRDAIDEAEPPTFFEFVTAMAFLYFHQQGAGPVILETGMGGRLDATNIVQPLVSVITNISLEHQEFLGKTLSAIAGEKAGIIKKGVPLITHAHQKRVLHLFQQRCRELGAPLYLGGVDFKTRGSPGGQFSYQGLKQRLDKLAINLPGRHQFRNAAVALAVLELLHEKGFPVTEADIREGLTAIRWPGRLERLPQDPRIILDGAHNPAAARSLAHALKLERPPGRRFLVMGIMADKDGQAILKSLLPLAQTVIFTRPRYFRAAKIEDLARRAEPYPLEVLLEPEVAQAVHRARSLAGPQDQVVVTGSLYTVGEALEYFEKVGGKGQALQTPVPPPNAYPHPQKEVDGGV